MCSTSRSSVSSASFILTGTRGGFHVIPKGGNGVAYNLISPVGNNNQAIKTSAMRTVLHASNNRFCNFIPNVGVFAKLVKISM